MNTPLHLFVHPVTGPNAGQNRVCYVCQYGSAPFIAAFIKRDTDQLSEYIDQVQKLKIQNPALGAIIVVLSEPDADLIAELKALDEAKQLASPIAVLDPELRLNSLPINPDAEITVLFFRGRQIRQKLENVDAGASLLSGGGNSFFNRGFIRDSPTTFKEVKVEPPVRARAALAGAGMDQPANQPPASAMFSEIEQAASDMLDRP